MDWVSVVTNLIGALSTRYQIEEAGPIGDYTEKDDKAEQLLVKHTPRWTLGDSSQREDAQTNRKQELVERAPKGLTKQLKSRCAGRTGNRRT